MITINVVNIIYMLSALVCIGTVFGFICLAVYMETMPNAVPSFKEKIWSSIFLTITAPILLGSFWLNQIMAKHPVRSINMDEAAKNLNGALMISLMVVLAIPGLVSLVRALKHPTSHMPVRSQNSSDLHSNNRVTHMRLPEHANHHL